jgi:hypothetical protein
VGVAAVIGMYSLWHGYRKHHHSMLPLSIFLSGISLLFARLLWHSYEFLLLPAAVLLIVSAHWINYRACRVHDHAHPEDCEH